MVHIQYPLEFFEENVLSPGYVFKSVAELSIIVARGKFKRQSTNQFNITNDTNILYCVILEIVLPTFWQDNNCKDTL